MNQYTKLTPIYDNFIPKKGQYKEKKQKLSRNN